MLLQNKNHSLFKKTTILLCLLLTACFNKNTIHQKQDKLQAAYYIEISKGDLILNNCIRSKLCNLWIETDTVLFNAILASGVDTSVQHHFFNIEQLIPYETPENLRKLKITINNTIAMNQYKYSIEVFKSSKNNTWNRICNMGEFNTNNIPKEKREIDYVCNEIVSRVVSATYK